MSDKREALDALIRPVVRSTYEVDSSWSGFLEQLRGMCGEGGSLIMNPDFQRGHVWTSDQQRLFLENHLRGILPSSAMSVQFNAPDWDPHRAREPTDLTTDLVCLDGLQRITAVMGFMDGEVRPFGLHVDDLAGTPYTPRITISRFRVAIYSHRTRAAVLQHYLDFNTGGTVHTQDEIERVQRLLAEASE